MEFLLHNALLLLLNPGKCSHNFVTFHFEYAVLCLVHVFLSDCRVLLIDLLLTGTLGNSRYHIEQSRVTEGAVCTHGEECADSDQSPYPHPTNIQALLWSYVSMRMILLF